MPNEPKKRHSRARQGKRRASIKLTHSRGIICANCGKVIVPHEICPNCGFYRGTEFVKRQTPKQKAA